MILEISGKIPFQLSGHYHQMAFSFSAPPWATRWFSCGLNPSEHGGCWAHFRVFHLGEASSKTPALRWCLRITHGTSANWSVLQYTLYCHLSRKGWGAFLITDLAMTFPVCFLPNSCFLQPPSPRGHKACLVWCIWTHRVHISFFLFVLLWIWA